MSRKTLKCSEETKRRFDALKREGETTDGLLNRAFDELEAEERRGDKSAPVCAKCGSATQRWTIINGSAVCPDCADVDF